VHHFQYRGEELWAEDVPVARIAAEVGTPFYVYSRATLSRHYRVFDKAFAAVDHLVCFSVKANSNLAVLRTLAGEGSGFDVVSGGELFRALRAGADARKIVFSGVGKTREEIAYGLSAGILMLHVESAQELEVVSEVARGLGRRAPVSLRVNPGVDPKTHPYVATGLGQSKFGIDLGASLDLYERARSLAGIEVVGVDCHIGSQLTEAAPFVDALGRTVELVAKLRERGFEVRYLDFGGGLGITYDDERPPDPSEYAAALIGTLGEALAPPGGGRGLTLILEPGRVIVGNAGIMVTEVLYVKEQGGKTFVVVDGGMNDLIRPALYGSYQGIQAVRLATDRKVVADVVGPVCESGDFFARDREVPAFAPGDLLAVMSAGAYGFVMASNYNSRPRPPEVLVDGERFYVVKERESLDDLVRGETLPPPLRQ
jgi:diaminopimelate decarboxylase